MNTPTRDLLELRRQAKRCQCKGTQGNEPFCPCRMAILKAMNPEPVTNG